MTPIDFAKALLVAIVIMAINVALSFAVIAGYAYGVDPGHTADYYEALAPRIAPWSSVIFGIPLFFLAAWLVARRRPTRNASAFALAFSLFYVVIDVAVLVAADSVTALGPIVALSMSTKVLAALAGAWSGRLRSSLRA